MIQLNLDTDFLTLAQPSSLLYILSSQRLIYGPENITVTGDGVKSAILRPTLDIWI